MDVEDVAGLVTRPGGRGIQLSQRIAVAGGEGGSIELVPQAINPTSPTDTSSTNTIRPPWSALNSLN